MGERDKNSHQERVEITRHLIRWINNLGGVQGSLVHILGYPETISKRRFEYIAEELEYMAKNIRERTGGVDVSKEDGVLTREQQQYGSPASIGDAGKRKRGRSSNRSS